jgi:hypothetical protein
VKRPLLPILACLALLLSHPAGAWDASRLAMPLMVNDLIVPYPVFSAFVMPGQPLSVGFMDAVGGTRRTLGGREVAVDDELRASGTPGLEVLRIENVATGEVSEINVFTLTPAAQVDDEGWLNGYRIGAYPRDLLRGLDIYAPPTGFVEVTGDNAGVRVSPNFTLGQFVSKQSSDYPRYLVLRAELLLKLENILGSLNQAGHPTKGLVIMSGYRTPFYNRAIGNVRYSRHVWGGAADVYIDELPADGIMDDLNGDGKFDKNDARWLARFVDDLSKDGAFGPRIGGLGIYGRTSTHGPFVHVDVRGSRARW